MLEIINYNQDEYDYPALIVLGCFDAIHVGHAELLKKAKLQAKINGLDLGVMMFAGGKGGRQVFTFDERLEMLAAYNTKFVLKIDYTDEFKSTAPLDFLKTLEEHINIKGYMSGKDFRFGYRAKGKSSTLKNYADDEDNAVWYMPLKDVMIDGEKVSTTLIKKYLEEGQIQQANKLLGRKYFVTGTVCKGSGRGGSELGFPTANIAYPEDKALVAEGVYGVEVVADGETYCGVANFGGRPTFGEESPVLEAYLENFSGDLYGKTVTVRFLNYIRSIVAFESKEALSAQIAEDLGKIGQPDAILFAEQPAAPVAVESEPVAAPAEVAAEVVAEPEVAAEEVAEPVEVEHETFEEVVSVAAELEEVIEEAPEEEIAEEPEPEEVEKTVEVEQPEEEVTATITYEAEPVAEDEPVEEPALLPLFDSELEGEEEEAAAQTAEDEQPAAPFEEDDEFGDELVKVDEEIAAIEAELYGLRDSLESTLGSIDDDEPADEAEDSDGISIFNDEEDKDD